MARRGAAAAAIVEDAEEMTGSGAPTGVGAVVSADPKTIVRTLRFEVVWPGWRRKDLLKLWAELWRAQDDLRRAANKAVAALWQVKIGALPRPMKEDGVTLVSDRTLAYQALSGKWKPFGEELYVPSDGVRRVSSQALLDVAGLIHTRLSTDMKDIMLGAKTLPSFRSGLPIGSTVQGIKVDQETGTISFPLWAGAKQRVTLRPRKLDARKWGDFRRALKFGSVRLQWDQPTGRKGRWMVSISAEYAAKERDTAAELMCAVRLGMHVTCTLAYASPGTGKVERYGYRVDIPASTWRAVRRVERERRERGLWNRKDHGVRLGRGRKRKLRAVDNLGDIVSRVTDTAIRQTAAAVIASAVRRGATAIVLPDLKHWSVRSELEKTDDLPEGDRTAHRKWYFRWHQGALRAQISEVALREGLSVYEVNPAGAGDECSECGEGGERAEGKFTCKCGCKLPVEVNTSRVLAKRALQIQRG